MALFLNKRADESEHSEGEIDDNDSQPARKKPRKQVNQSSDEEEEEDDERVIAKEMEGFVVSGDEEEEGEENKSEKSSSSDDDEDLAEDRELLAENLNLPAKPVRKVRVLEDDEEEEQLDDQHRIERQLFAPGDDDERREERSERPASPLRDDDASSDDNDDFFVDDNNQSQRHHRPRRNRNLPVSADALAEAQELFGVGFDFEDFYDDNADELAEGAGEYADEEEENADVGQISRRARKKKQRTLLQEIEPSELERGYLAEKDRQVVLEDRPERYQLRTVPVSAPATDTELRDEAEWILDRAFPEIVITQQHHNEKIPLIERSKLDEKNFEKGELDRMSAEEKDNCKRFLTQEEKTETIRNVLDMIRVKLYEVPFIAFYRKENLEDYIPINDLWRILAWDEKWCLLTARKEKLVNLFKRMQAYQMAMAQLHTSGATDTAPIGLDTQLITADNIDIINGARSMEDLSDVYAEFQLYHGAHVSKMMVFEQHRPGDGTDNEERERLALAMSKYKQPTLTDRYSICVQNGLSAFAAKYGLSARQLGENFAKEFMAHEVEPYPFMPEETADDYVKTGGVFPDRETVMKGADYMVAKQLSRDPVLRKKFRDMYIQRAMITVNPTKMGLVEIDENHPLYGTKYLLNKPVNTLQKDEFLKMVQAEKNNLLTISISPDEQQDKDDETRAIAPTLFEDIWSMHYYMSTDVSDVAQAWNERRRAALQQALHDILYPMFARELRDRLLAEARQGATRICCEKIYNWLKVAPYPLPAAAQNEAVMPGERHHGASAPIGCRVLGITYSSERDQAGFGALIDSQGELVDHIRLVHITKRLSSRFQQDKVNKRQDLEALRKFIIKRRPHVIALAAENMDARAIKRDLEVMLNEMYTNDETSWQIEVEFVDNELAKVYMNSATAQRDFADLPFMLRQAISLARRLQDPLVEFCQAFNDDDDLLCLSLHAAQDMVCMRACMRACITVVQISREELVCSLEHEFINRVNEVGVDINRCLEHPHTSNMLKFVAGLGPRKASYLLKTLKNKNNNIMEARYRLVKRCDMGSVVYMNCAGFIKIDTARVADKTDIYIETLDGTRIHPEAYEYARKMATDALDDDQVGDQPPTEAANALEEVLEQPEKLHNLDLNAFATELKRQGLGEKLTTLIDIRVELEKRYNDLRTSYESPQGADLFNMLTKESPDTFNVGRIVLVRVMFVQRERPPRLNGDDSSVVPAEAALQPAFQEIDNVKWYSCPRCHKGGYDDLARMWDHMDTWTKGTGGNDQCPGKARGVMCRLENGLVGIIKLDNLSDESENIQDPSQKVSANQSIYCRVQKVDVERISCDLTCKSSHLVDKENQFKPQVDSYYNRLAESRDREALQDRRAKQFAEPFVKRIIVHPAFHNVSYREAEKMLAQMDDGDCIIRPSARGANLLSLTWRVYKGIYQHITIEERNKDNQFSLGRQLVIQDEVFEDLDEIIARFVQPMAQNARDIVSHAYFVEPPIEQPPNDVGAEQEQKRYAPMENFEFIEQRLSAEKAENPKRIPYILSPTHRQIGKFMLSYMPGLHARHEYISVTHRGYRFRYRSNERDFSTLNTLFNWFKAHYNEPVAGMKDPIEAEKDRLQKLALREQQRLAHEPTPSMHNMPHQTPGSVRSSYIESTGAQRQRVQRRDMGAAPNMRATPASQTPYHTPGSRYMDEGGGRTPSHQTAAMASLEQDMQAAARAFNMPVNDVWQQPLPQQQNGAPPVPPAHFGANTNWANAARLWQQKQQ